MVIQNFYKVYNLLYKMGIKPKDILGMSGDVVKMGKSLFNTRVNPKLLQFVEKNQIIGQVGKSENDDGPHLHFEIWHNNIIIDPRNLIEEYKLKDVSIK